MITGFGHVAHGIGIYRSPIKVDRPERHGKYCFFPIAALVTAAARLKLALGQRLVEDEGGHVAYCDTDSLVIVANEKGGYVACEGGEYVEPDGRRYIKVLSYEQVDRILQRLEPLNPYDKTVVPGSIFKVERVNYVDDDPRKGRRALRFYGVRDKCYALYALNDRGELEIVKASSHGMGVYRSPIKGDHVQENGVPKWLEEAHLRLVLGLSAPDAEWLDCPATLSVTISQPSVWMRYLKTCRPFDFLVTATPIPKFKCLFGCGCDNPRPATHPYDDARDWKKQVWFCLRCGRRVEIVREGLLIVKTYGDVLREALFKGFQRKRLAASGKSPTYANPAVGLTIPRPNVVEEVQYCGKEVVVDVSEAPGEEGITLEELSGAQAQMYQKPAAHEARRLLAEGVNVADAARVSGVHRTTIRRIQNGQKPRGNTARKLICADPDPEPASAEVQDAVRELVRKAGIEPTIRAAGLPRSTVFHFLADRDARVETLERLIVAANSILQPDKIVVPFLPYVLVVPTR